MEAQFKFSVKWSAPPGRLSSCWTPCYLQPCSSPCEEARFLRSTTSLIKVSAAWDWITIQHLARPKKSVSQVTLNWINDARVFFCQTPSSVHETWNAALFFFSSVVLTGYLFPWIMLSSLAPKPIMDSTRTQKLAWCVLKIAQCQKTMTPDWKWAPPLDKTLQEGMSTENATLAL